MATKELTVKTLFAQDKVKDKFKELLGARSAAFMTSVVQIVANNSSLVRCEPMSIFNAAAMAATLDLPINNQLGFAYILPYGQQASFQLGYRAYIQLAQRTGQFKTISATPVYEGQISGSDPLTGFKFDWGAKKSDEIIGFAAYFELLNGFEKTFYMTKGELEKHGAKYSKTYNKSSSLWKKDFEAMATKTVLKLLLSKFAPLSIEMQQAVIVDQAVINDVETQDITYVDNEQPAINPPIIENKAIPTMKPEYPGWLKCRKAILVKSITVAEVKENYLLSDADEKLLTAPETVADLAPAKVVKAVIVEQPIPETPAVTIEAPPEQQPEKSTRTLEPAPPELLPELNEQHPKWTGAKKALLSKLTTVEMIRGTYTVSKEDELKLMAPPIENNK